MSEVLQTVILGAGIIMLTTSCVLYHLAYSLFRAATDREEYARKIWARTHEINLATTRLMEFPDGIETNQENNRRH